MKTLVSNNSVNDGPARDSAESVEIDLLLSRLERRGWEFHYFEAEGQRPAELAVTRRWGGPVVDVVVVRDDGTAVAYRTVRADDHDPLRPQLITLRYADTVLRTLRVVQSFRPPHIVNTPLQLAPPDCGVRSECRPSHPPATADGPPPSGFHGHLDVA